MERNRKWAVVLMAMAGAVIVFIYFFDLLAGRGEIVLGPNSSAMFVVSVLIFIRGLYLYTAKREPSNIMQAIIGRLGELIHQRELLKNFMLRNLRVKYKGSVLGFFWVLLNPLLTIVVLTFVFTKVVRIRVEQYPLFLLTGIFPWTFFVASLIEATNSILENANLVKKVNFPKEILPISYCLTNFISLMLSLLVAIPILNLCGIHQGWLLFFLPFLLLIHLLFTMGMALFLSCANVYFRDVNHILSVGLLLWFYLTPIFYPLDAVPREFYNIILINPMVSIIALYRNILFEAQIPLLFNFVIAFLYSIVFFIAGYLFFITYDKNMVKEI